MEATLREWYYMMQFAHLNTLTRGATHTDSGPRTIHNDSGRGGGESTPSACADRGPKHDGCVTLDAYNTGDSDRLTTQSHKI